MAKKEHIVRYSADELAKMKSETDWAKVDATTQDEVERQAGEDEGPLPDGWEKTVIIGLPPGKEAVALAPVRIGRTEGLAGQRRAIGRAEQFCADRIGPQNADAVDRPQPCRVSARRMQREPRIADADSCSVTGCRSVSCPRSAAPSPV